MKTVFDQNTRDELISRVGLLTADCKSQWGKMNVHQMMQHCTRWDTILQSKQQQKQVIIGKLFGKFALKNVLKDDKPLRKNTPTIPALIIKESDGNIDLQKSAWVQMINGMANYDNPGFVHPFFGKMTREQIGYLTYKHLDHHLRQFGV